MADKTNLSLCLLSLGLLAFLWTAVMATDLQGCSLSLVKAGLVPAAEPSHVFSHVDTALRCAWACLSSLGLGECLSLSHSQGQRECRVYSSVSNSSDVNVSRPGHQYYSVDPVPVASLIGDPCGGDWDCTVDNAECRDSTCQCVIGYHFYPGPGACVEVCPNGYRNDFYEMRGWTLLGYNDEHYQEISQQQCLDHCRNNPLCSNVHHSECECYLSYSTRPKIPDSAWKSSNTYDYYQRYCM